MHQRAGWAGADLTLVQCEEGKTFERLVEEGIVLIHHIGKEDVGDLPPSSSVMLVTLSAAYRMISLPTEVEPVKAILAMRFALGQRLATSRPVPLTMLRTPPAAADLRSAPSR